MVTPKIPRPPLPEGAMGDVTLPAELVPDLANGLGQMVVRARGRGDTIPDSVRDLMRRLGREMVK